MDKKYISKIVNGSDTLYIKDEEAREALSGLTSAMHYVGATTTAIADGDTTSVIVIDGENHTAAAGDVVIYGELELVWSGSKWQELGSTGSIKALAFKDNASASYQPAGSNAPSTVTFTGTADADFVTGIDTAAVAPSFTEGTFSAGTLPSFTEGAFSAGTLPSLGAATTGNFATEGITASYTENTETLTLGTASTSAAVTAQGAFSAGTLPSKAADTFSAGELPSKAADTFSAGSAATFSTAKAITALGTAEAAAQTFTGTSTTITVA